MKALLITAAIFATPFTATTAFTHNPDSLPATVIGTEPVHNLPSVDELFLNNPELYQNRLYFHIYDKEDQEILSKDHTSESLQNDQELLAVLKRSKLLVKADNHYFFYLKD